MIRIQAVHNEAEGVTQLILTSNNIKEDQDEMDRIGNALVSEKALRRGGYEIGTGALNVFVKDEV